MTTNDEIKKAHYRLECLEQTARLGEPLRIKDRTAFANDLRLILAPHPAQQGEDTRLLDYANKFRRVTDNEVQWVVAVSGDSFRPDLTLRDALKVTQFVECAFNQKSP